MVKRYDPERFYDGVTMEEDRDGDYVKWSDYVALAERCERLEAALRAAAGYLDDVQDAGPPGGGYKSDGLEALLRDITALLPNSGGYE